ncbi:hypothetical protein lerEdw1_020430 [Lerista edwardsae]|nr:hypothetical protein lerEdw1_020430 [Lerista edwardsae]
MTAVCVEESIYNLLPHVTEPEKPIQPPRYISKLKPYVKRTIQQSKEKWKTMGPPKTEAPSPKDFLLKHSKEIKLPKRTV